MRDEAGVAGEDIRERILDNPGVILDDEGLMRALVKAERRSAGRNVVDLRGVLVERLEERLDRLEDTHREVIAAAYENVAGMNQVHRACLAVLDAPDFPSFLAVLARDLPGMLGVEVARLALEAPAVEPGQPLGPEGGLEEVAVALPAGGAAAYATLGRGLGGPRVVTLRPVGAAAEAIYGRAAGAVRSEALMLLDLGAGGLQGLLALGSVEAERFHSDQGTDLLAFFAGVFERALKRWLA